MVLARRAFLLALFSLSAQAENSLSGRIGNYSAYFFDDQRLRHHRYEFHLKQTATLSPRLLTVVSGRARADLALAPNDWAPRNYFPASVQDDEYLEAEPREVYADYLSDIARVKVGLQQIDWVESLAPFLADLLTPQDLRHGGFGDADQVIVPVMALNANHKLGGGSIDWLVIPFPSSSRIPNGENGYGYLPFIERQVAPSTALITEEKIPHRVNEIEFGARYMMSLGGVDLTFLAFRGHQRTPALTITPTGVGQVSVVQSYPRLVTLGISSSYSDEAWVARLFAYVEPTRAPRAFVQSPGAVGVTARRFRIGTGFDYVFSSDLKVYSEFLITREDESNDDGSGRTTKHDYIATLRLTNESFNATTLSLNMTVTFPEVSYVINPDATWGYRKAFRFSVGGRFIRSESPTSDFEVLKSVSQVYGSVAYLFDVK